MKKLLILSVVLLTCGLTPAQEVGRVVSSTPITQQVGQPRTVCTTEQVAVQQRKSGAGALMGALAGGAVGNAIGAGGGKVAATMIGIMGGAIVGDNVEGAPMAQAQNVQRCGTQTFFENRIVAYNVVYEYAGKQYSVQMPNDPGRTVELQISPVGAIHQGLPPANTATYQQPANSEPVTVFPAQPSYPVYDQPVFYPPIYYPPIRLNFGFGYAGGRGGHHRHWR